MFFGHGTNAIWECVWYDGISLRCLMDVYAMILP